MEISQPVQANAFLIIRLPKGWTDGAHPAPARQLMVLVQGKLEVTTSGECRQFGVGDVALVEGTGGVGPGTTAIEESVVAIVRV